MKALPIAMAVAALAFATSLSAQQLNTTNTKQLGKLGQVNGQPKGQGATPGAGAAAGSADAQSTMADLVSRGYEIKAAVPNGSGKFIVFMQKDKSAYACEFSSLTGARCGSIN
jgi:hypothetical protein